VKRVEIKIERMDETSPGSGRRRSQDGGGEVSDKKLRRRDIRISKLDAD
jgi:ribosomal protein L20A (L18A)